MPNIKETSTLFVEAPGRNGDVAIQTVRRESDPLVSNEALAIAEVFFSVSLNSIISVIGIVTNVINIVVLVKQGLNDPVNISLCGLAVSDLGSLLTLVWKGICFNPLLKYSDVQLDFSDVQYISAGMPHMWFVRITSWITAFITFQRCLCVALPMKVKNIITPKRTKISIAIIFIAMFVCFIPTTRSVRFGLKFGDKRNTTFIGLIYYSNSRSLENISYYFSVLSQFTSFIIVFACTSILILKLIAKSKWRNKAVANIPYTKADSILPRDKRIMKMVVSISCIFIACSLPASLNVIFLFHFSATYSATGIYTNTAQVAWMVCNMLEAFNSSLNILVYYNMSSKFRDMFIKLFSFGKQDCSDVKRLGITLAKKQMEILSSNK